MRTSRVDKNGFKKGAWSKEEDQKLIDYINRYRIWNWALMPKYAGLSRNGKSCRLRWVNYLDPNIRHGNITKEEENIIIDMYARIGSRWSKIAAKLPGRSDNEIKNYWHTHLKKLFNEKPKKMVESLAIEISKLEPIQENPYGCKYNLIPSSTVTSEASNSQDSSNPTMTPYSTTDGCGDFQEIDQEKVDSSTGDLINSFWAQPFFPGNGDMEIEYEQKKEVDVQWYQEPLSPYGIFNNEHWLNEFRLMNGSEQRNINYKDEF